MIEAVEKEAHACKAMVVVTWLENDADAWISSHNPTQHILENRWLTIRSTRHARKVAQHRLFLRWIFYDCHLNIQRNISKSESPNCASRITISYPSRSNARSE